MEDEILRAAKAEAQRLEVLLRQHPTFLRLEAVRRVIELYDAKQDIVTVKPSIKPRKGSLAANVREIAVNYLRQKGARAKSGEIYQTVVNAGVNVPGEKPVSVVSSYLSGSDLFDNTAEGYGLTEWRTSTAEGYTEPEVTENEPPASGASGSNSGDVG
jgi:hypothetical protein